MTFGMTLVVANLNKMIVSSLQKVHNGVKIINPSGEFETCGYIDI